MTKAFTAPQKSAALALARLSPDAPDFTGSPEIAEALRKIGPYLGTWVLPHIAYAAGIPEAYYGQRRDLQMDVASRKARIVRPPSFRCAPRPRRPAAGACLFRGTADPRPQ